MTLSMSVLATVEGYQDIYLDREKPIHIHSIYCAENLSNLHALKNSYAYTNSEFIERGTYYFSSAYGNFSYTYNTIPGQDSQQVMARGLLTGGHTNKDEMRKEVCIVGAVPGLPAQLSQNIGTTTLSADDKKWDALMVKLAMFGKPAFAEGIYTDPRTLAKYDAKNNAVYEANQAYIAEAKQLFRAKFSDISATLPKQVNDAITYAYQHDGFLQTKTYPIVKEPSVWTAVAKERFDEQNRQLAQEKAWDQVIQKNFDWFFQLTTKGNAVQSVKPGAVSVLAINNGVIEQTRSMDIRFDDGKVLTLDFIIRSHPLPKEVFATLSEIAQEADAVRASAIAGSRETRTPISLPSDIEVYSSAEKTVIFFSPFREKVLGDSYRYQ